MWEDQGLCGNLGYRTYTARGIGKCAMLARKTVARTFGSVWFGKTRFGAATLEFYKITWPQDSVKN